MSDSWYNSVEEKSGGFFKIVYDPSLSNKPVKKRLVNTTENLSSNSIELGKRLFDERACSACHSAGGAELLGPNLNGVGKRLSRQDILEEIEFPSRIIKPSMGAMRIIKKNGQVLFGRVIHSDENQVSMMLIGNKKVSIPRTDIQRTENEEKSLMYENLLGGLTKDEINSLVDYIVSLK